MELEFEHYKELMEYLEEIKTIVEYHKLDSSMELALTILAVCKVNNLDYEKFKESILNCDNKETLINPFSKEGINNKS